MDLKQEYPQADFANIETFKQVAINKFKENGLGITKIRNARIKLESGMPDGFFIYHKFGAKQYQNKRLIIEETDNKIVYKRYKKEYRCDWITTESIEFFEDMLEMTIQEAKRRKG